MHNSCDILIPGNLLSNLVWRILDVKDTRVEMVEVFITMMIAIFLRGKQLYMHDSKLYLTKYCSRMLHTDRALFCYVGLCCGLEPDDFVYIQQLFVQGHWGNRMIVLVPMRQPWSLGAVQYRISIWNWSWTQISQNRVRPWHPFQLSIRFEILSSVTAVLCAKTSERSGNCKISNGQTRLREI